MGRQRRGGQQEADTKRANGHPASLEKGWWFVKETHSDHTAYGAILRGGNLASTLETPESDRGERMLQRRDPINQTIWPSCM